jgi:hypothetical protein
VLRPLLARLVDPLVWRRPRRAARLLMSFARAEEGSRLDLLAAARLTPSPERRVLYLRHALDEGRHATVFARRSAELAAQAGLDPPGSKAADIDDLYQRLGELGFVAFVHRGERRGRLQFEAHRDYFARRGDERMRAVFEGVLVDERRHEAYTEDLLRTLAGSARAARRALGAAALWEAWRSWRRLGRGLASRTYAVLMAGLYLVLAPVGLVVRWTAPVRAGWRGPGR